MKNVQHKSVDQEKNLGIIITSDLKPSNQCIEVVKNTNKLVGFIGRTFNFNSEKVILTLYNTFDHPVSGRT